jgi:hypothetical protein
MPTHSRRLHHNFLLLLLLLLLPGIAQGRQAIHSPNPKEGDRIGRLLENIRILSPLALKSASNTHSTPRTKFDLPRGDTLFFSSVERVL